MKDMENIAKEEGCSSVSEYHDMLSMFDKNTGNRSYDDIKSDIDEIFESIHIRYGSLMSSRRMTYLLMKNYHLSLYEAQRTIRSALQKQIIGLNDRLKVSFDSKDKLSM